ncbi:MAG TPA: reductive dehalogenase [Conexivisphaerales archaeon]|nr:reductive dehalogenase [Conexivisphaerales archaeon]
MRKRQPKPKGVDTARRNLIKATGFLGVAALAGSATPTLVKPSAPMDAGLPAPKILTGKTAADIFQVKPDFKRFDVRNTSFTRSATDPNSIAYLAAAKYTLVFEQRVRNDEVGFRLQDYALYNAALTVATATGSGLGNRDAGLYKWTSLGAAKVPYNVSKLDREPGEMAAIVKKAAKGLGASLVGLCELDRRWVYANDTIGRPIVFEDVSAPYANDDKVVIPNSFRSVVVLATLMDISMVKYAPYGISAAGVWGGYDNMPIIAARVAEFIRGLGWQAIPMGNDTMLSIPLAIDAGLGQFGRICRLVTPQYGPNIRLMKVLTDLPLSYDAPIDFGLTEFCNNCKKCVQACPPQALPYGDPSYQGTTPSEMTGILKWQQQSDKCLRWWGQVGTGCAICIRVCPWTNGIMHNNGLAQDVAMNVPQLDHTLRQLDDDFGNGVLTNPATFWTGSKSYGPQPNPSPSPQ